MEYNQEFESVPETINESTEKTQTEVNSTTKEMSSDQLEKLALRLGKIGIGIPFFSGIIFIGLFMVIIGFALVQYIEYIIFFSTLASISIILGITSVVLMFIRLKKYKTFSISGFLLGIFAILSSSVALYVFITCYAF